MTLRRSIVTAVTLASSFLLPFAASAQTATGFTVNRFEPSTTGSDWFVLDSLDLRGHARPALGVVGEWAYRPLVIYNHDGTVRESIVRNQITAHLGGSIVLWDRLRVGATLPIQVFADGHGGSYNGVFYAPPSSTTSVGDLRLDADLRLLGVYGDPFTVAIGANVWIPTGSSSSYSGDTDARVGGHLIAAGDLGPFVYSARIGIRYRSRTDAVGDGVIGSDLDYGVSAGVRVLDKKLVIGPEIFGSTVVSNSNAAFSTLGSPAEGLLGAHLMIANAWRLGGGLSTGISKGFGAPAVRGLINIEWAPGIQEIGDRDHDGIFDDKDACPDVAGLPSDDPSINGCPPPADRDHDGILDDKDACPDVPGVKTDDPKTNGCPADRDHDGVPDSLDACPDTPGVASPDAKKNGCPPDRDGDGVLDADDACPDVPGLKTADPKTNGCPDPDRDKDGIPNDTDACPDEPGKPDADPKRNGCPKAFVRNGQIRILDQVKFATGSAKILPGHDSEDVLDAVLKVIQAHPEITKLRIEGHTDNVGQPVNNKKLSADRAGSVVKWLVSHGIAATRLTSAGFGQDKPIDTNSTAEGRKNNRRVEFHIEGGESAPPPPAP